MPARVAGVPSAKGRAGGPRDGYDRDAFGSSSRYQKWEDEIVAGLPKSGDQEQPPYSCTLFDIRDDGTAATTCNRAANAVPRPLQQLTQRWLFFAPSRSNSTIVSTNGWIRCTGPFAMSTVVCPLRATAVTSAPCSTR